MLVRLILAVILSLPVSVYAGDYIQTCAKLGGVAEKTMIKRQEGFPMQKLMEVVAVGDLREMMESLIIAAYDSPRYATAGMQQKAVEDFRNDVYLQCVKKYRD